MKNIPSKSRVALLAGAVLLPMHAQATVLSLFEFTGPPWSAQKESDFATFAAAAGSTDADPNSVTSDLTNSGHTGGGYNSFYIRDIDGGTVGVADGGDFVIYSTTDSPGVGINVGLSNATEPTNYIAFSVTPAEGFETTFESISLFSGANGASDQYNVEIRVWDGTSETSLALIDRTTPDTGGNQPLVKDSFDFEDFSATTAMEFRLYSYNVTGGGASGGVRMDDITLNGTTSPVPEPSALALLGLAGFASLIRRRK